MFRRLHANLVVRRGALSAWGAAVFMASLPALAQAQAAGEWRSPQHIFKQTCAFCHGTGVGPELRGRQLPPEYISYVMLNGLRAMPAFRPTDFSPAEVAALAKMIHESPAPADAKGVAAGGTPTADTGSNRVGAAK
jgi:mono/diheme cytochrome c family protein